MSSSTLYGFPYSPQKMPACREDKALGWAQQEENGMGKRAPVRCDPDSCTRAPTTDDPKRAGKQSSNSTWTYCPAGNSMVGLHTQGCIQFKNKTKQTLFVGESLSSSQRGRPRDKLRPPSLSPSLASLSFHRPEQANKRPTCPLLSPSAPTQPWLYFVTTCSSFPKSAIFPLHFSPFSPLTTQQALLWSNYPHPPPPPQSPSSLLPPANCANKLQRAPSLPFLSSFGGELFAYLRREESRREEEDFDEEVDEGLLPPLPYLPPSFTVKGEPALLN